MKPTNRKIFRKTRGQKRGPITRLVSPSDLGELIKPFVFLDHINVESAGSAGVGWHPHSGIATVTVIFEGDSVFEDSTGAKGILKAGGIEWMLAGGGVWHTAGPAPGQDVSHGFQLWLALPPNMENTASRSKYVDPKDVPRIGPARVIVGRYGNVVSPLDSLPGVNYLDVQLPAGESWTYAMPSEHTVCWLAVHRGHLLTPERVNTGEVAVFQEGNEPLEIAAGENVAFVVGSAIKHEHSLVLGAYSVHTTREALTLGERGITRIGEELRSNGRL